MKEEDVDKKAKEYADFQYGWSEATEEEKLMFTPDYEECKIHFKNGLKYGCKHKQKEIIEKLRKFMQGELKTMQQIYPGSDWNEESEIFSVADIEEFLEQLTTPK